MGRKSRGMVTGVHKAGQVWGPAVNVWGLLVVSVSGTQCARASQCPWAVPSVSLAGSWFCSQCEPKGKPHLQTFLCFFPSQDVSLDCMPLLSLLLCPQC